MTRRAMLRTSSLALAWAGCGRSSEAPPPESVDTVPWVEEQLAQLHIGEKVGQLLCLSPTSGDLENLVQSAKATAAYLPDGLSIEDVVRLGNRYQDLARLPMLLMGRAGAGLGDTIRGATRLPCPLALGATGSEDMARLAARITASEAKALGIYRPSPVVADLAAGAGGSLIPTSILGDSPEAVGRLAVALVTELQAEGCAGTALPFPGAGNLGSPQGWSWEERLAPFRTLIQNGVKSIGMSTAAWPPLEPDLPATLSRRVVSGLLRQDLGFQGVIASAGLSHPDFAAGFAVEEAAVKGFQAGLDLLLAYPETENCHQTLVASIAADPAWEGRLDASVRRLLMLKHWARLHEDRFVNLQNALAIVGREEHRQGALEIARRAVTAIRGSDFVAGLKAEPELLLVVPRSAPRATGERPSEDLLARAREILPRARLLSAASDPDEAEHSRVLGEAQRAGRVLIAVFEPAPAAHSSDPAAGRWHRLGQALAETRPTAAIAFASPSLLGGLPAARALICAYDSSPACLQAGLELCAGRITAQGALPVRMDL